MKPDDIVLNLKVTYFGWDYHGFAVQEITGKTIESELFRALAVTRLIEGRETSNYHRCGRTDKGVSAFGQIIVRKAGRALCLISLLPFNSANAISFIPFQVHRRGECCRGALKIDDPAITVFAKVLSAEKIIKSFFSALSSCTVSACLVARDAAQRRGRM